jgi:hypothetical protein
MAEVETAPVVQARHVVYCGGEDPRGANHNWRGGGGAVLPAKPVWDITCNDGCLLRSTTYLAIPTQSRPIQFTKVLFSYIMAEVETAPVVQARHVVYCGAENWDRGGKLEGHTSGGNVQTIRISAIFSNELESSHHRGPGFVRGIATSH